MQTRKICGMYTVVNRMLHCIRIGDIDLPAVATGVFAVVKTYVAVSAVQVDMNRFASNSFLIVLRISVAKLDFTTLFACAIVSHIVHSEIELQCIVGEAESDWEGK